MDDEQIITQTLRPWVTPAVVGVVSFAAGAIGGYFLGKRGRDTVYIPQHVVDTIGLYSESREVLGEMVVTETKEGLVGEGTLNEAGKKFIEEQLPVGGVVYREIELDETGLNKNADDALAVIRAQRRGMLDEVKEAENRDIRLGTNNKTQYHRVDVTAESEAETRHEVYEAAREAEAEGEPEAPVLPEPRHNVFRTNRAEDRWDFDSEQSTRTKEAPYIIHKDEFDADERGFTQATLTYYAIDDVITDSLDSKIGGNWRALLGELRFGHGSEDPNVVYIRNEQTEMEYEVCYTNESYEQEHGGLIYDPNDPEELRHSQHRILKMRQDD